VTGEWWSFGLFCDGRMDGDMMLQVIDKQGKLYRQERFQSPFPGLSHDFAVTREHVIFAVMPLTVDQQRIQQGGDFYRFDPDLPSAWGIMPRAGSTQDIRWFRVPNCFSGHIMNAYTEGNLVHVDATISRGNGFRFYPDIHGHPTPAQDGKPTITRLTFDLSDPQDNCRLTPVAGAVGEMPRLDERYAMSAYRWGYIKTPTGVGRIDWKHFKIDQHPVAGSTQEPVFVPRSADAPEGSGYLLCVANMTEARHAVLLVLDAEDIQAAPTAIVKLPFLLPGAFHGMFVPQADLPA
ncbi:carotenoid oxygenase family protein, partial [Acidovorax cavernicola]